MRLVRGQRGRVARWGIVKRHVRSRLQAGRSRYRPNPRAVLRSRLCEILDALELFNRHVRVRGSDGSGRHTTAGNRASKSRKTHVVFDRPRLRGNNEREDHVPADP
jgi:hypothetical protein